MGGVDKADMLISSYGLSRKSRKLRHIIFFGLVDQALCNAFIAFNKITKAKMKSWFLKKGSTISHYPWASFKSRTTFNICSTSCIKKEKVVDIFRSSVTSERKSGGSLTQLKTVVVVRYVQRTSKKLAPHIKYSACDVFLCLNENKNCFAKFHDLNSAFYVAIVTYFVSIYKEK